METGLKIAFAIIILAAIFVFLPNIIGMATNVTGGAGGTDTGAVAAGMAGLLTISMDGGDTFKDAAVHASGVPNISGIVNRGIFYYAATNSGLLISKDKGVNWYSFTDLEKKIDSGTVVYGFTFQPGSSAIFISALKNNHGYVYKTTDNFFSVDSVWDEPQVAVRAMAADNGFLYMGTSDGRLLRYRFAANDFEKIKNFDGGIADISLSKNGGTIFVTLAGGQIMKNSGSGWAAVQNNSSFFGFGSQSVKLVLNEDTRGLYIASVSGIFRSPNEGVSWNNVNTVVAPQAPIGALTVANGIIYMSNGYRIYISDDGGVHWQIKEPFSTQRPVSALYVSGDGKVVIAGTTAGK